MRQVSVDTIKRILKEEVGESSIDKSIFNFLRRHSKIDEKSFGDDLKVKTLAFNFNDEWYTFTSFMSKKEIKNKKRIAKVILIFNFQKPHKRTGIKI
jgi:hypothetical protein